MYNISADGRRRGAILTHISNVLHLANGQDTQAIQLALLRHKNIQHTVRYTRLSSH